MANRDPAPLFSLICSTRKFGPHLNWLEKQRSPTLQVVIIENDGRVSLGQAYAEGLQQASGEFCCFLHDDVRVEPADWLEQMRQTLLTEKFDLLGVAGTTCMTKSGAWWLAGPNTGRGSVFHTNEINELDGQLGTSQPERNQHPHQEKFHADFSNPPTSTKPVETLTLPRTLNVAKGQAELSCFGLPDQLASKTSPVVSLDGLLLFGRRADFLHAPFDTMTFGFDFYDSDLCLNWLIWQNKRLGVYHGLDVYHQRGASIERWHEGLPWFQRRFGPFLDVTLAGREVWQRNLAALACQPQLRAMLSRPDRPGRWLMFERQPEGLLALAPGLKSQSAEESSDDVQEESSLHISEMLVDPPTPTIAESARIVILLGIGAGTIFNDLLQTNNRAIVLIEPEPGLLLHHLQHHDLSNALNDGRLTIRCPDLTDTVTRELAVRETAIWLASLPETARREIQFVATASTSHESAFFERVEESANTIASTPARLSAWPTKPASFDFNVISPKCAIFSDLAECLAQLEQRVRTMIIPDRMIDWQKSSVWQMLRTLSDQPATVTITRNRCGFETIDPTWLAPTLADTDGKFPAWLSKTIVHWWWDQPTIATQVDQTLAANHRPSFAIAQSTLPLLPAGAQWLPPAARMAFARFDPATFPQFADYARQLGSKVVMVGQSRHELVAQNLQRLVDRLSRSDRRLTDAFARAMSAAKTIDARYQTVQQFNSQLRAVIDGMGECYPNQAYYLHYLLDMIRTGLYRQHAVAALSELPLVVFGDQGWLASGLIEPEQYLGPIDPSLLPVVYASAGININLNFMQVGTGVNPRVLDIIAAGGDVLTDPTPELALLFPTHQPESFVTIAELVDKSAQYLALNRQRDPASVGLADRDVLKQYVHDHHLMKHRATQLLNLIAQ